MPDYDPTDKRFQDIRKEVLDLARDFVRAYHLLLWLWYGTDYRLIRDKFLEPLGPVPEGGVPPLDDKAWGEIWKSIIPPYAHSPIGKIPVWNLKQDEARDSTIYLLDLLEDVEGVAEIDATQALTAARDKYLAVYESFKPLWPLAKAWGIGDPETDVWEGDIDEIRDKLSSLEETRGRPSVIASDLLVLWERGNAILGRFNGNDPGATLYAQRFLQVFSEDQRSARQFNPSRTLLRRAGQLLTGKNGHQISHWKFIEFLRGPKPPS